MSNNQGEDYLDKAVDAIERKVGQRAGVPVDPQQLRNQNEKFTDKARGVFESITGKKVPPKVSN